MSECAEVIRGEMVIGRVEVVCWVACVKELRDRHYYNVTGYNIIYYGLQTGM